MTREELVAMAEQILGDPEYQDGGMAVTLAEMVVLYFEDKED
jgi:hypothetical protein